MIDIVTTSQHTLNQTRIASERSDLRWKRAKRSFFAVTTVLGTVLYLMTMNEAQDWWTSSDDALAPVVRIEGSIKPGSNKGGADAIIAALNKAFKRKSATGVVLYVDSPGGSPGEAERITRVIQDRKAETGKKIYAVCANLCASAAYMIAMHADEVYAGKYSMVGSIGAILSTWNFSEAIHKLGVQHHAYASGHLKAMLNPYIPLKPEDEAKAQTLVVGLGKVFAAEVQKMRGNKLSSDVNLFTGEVWTGEEAKSVGLVDGMGTLDSVLKDKFGKGASAQEITIGRNFLPDVQSSLEYFAKRIVTEILDQLPMTVR